MSRQDPRHGWKSPLFIVLEGGEGSGKTTQARLLHRHLRRLGMASLLTSDPGGTPAGKRAERWLKHPQALPEAAELLCFAACRSLLITSVIRPALKEGSIVVCDRYAPSTTAYQGYGRGLDLAMVRSINEFATGGLRPDIVILLDIPPDKGLERKGKDLPDRFQHESLSFHHRVREGYLKMAAADPQRWDVLDATLPKSKLFELVWQIVSPALGHRGGPAR